MSKPDTTMVVEGVQLLSSVELCRQSGISYRLLLRWKDQGFVVPDLVERNHQSFGGKFYWWSEDWLATIKDMLERMNACPYHHPTYDYS